MKDFSQIQWQHAAALLAMFNISVGGLADLLMFLEHDYKVEGITGS